MNSRRNSSQADAALALLPMHIPGWKTPVLPTGAYHGGIPLTIHSPSLDLYMVIDPLTTLSKPLAINDSVELWVNGKPTSVIKVIRAGEENDRIELELPWGWLVNSGNTLFYRVTRPGGNFDDSVPVLDLLFHSPSSGITVSHPASVSPAQPGTFTFTRSYPREYDEVTLTVGTWSKTIPYVHPANPITYTLTATELQQIGDGTHPVSARVVDQLGNSNVSPPSEITILPSWTDINTTFQDLTYDSWLPHQGARSGSIQFWETKPSFCNFTADSGVAWGFAGAIFYRDVTFVPGHYRFEVTATHAAFGAHLPNLVNPIIGLLEDGDLNNKVVVELPKNGVFYTFGITLTVTAQQTRRLQVVNYQDWSNGNDFVIASMTVKRIADGAMSGPQYADELPPYDGPLPEITVPLREK